MSRDAAEDALRAEVTAARSRSLRAAACGDAALATLLLRAGNGARRRAQRLRQWLGEAPPVARTAPPSPAPVAKTAPEAKSAAARLTPTAGVKTPAAKAAPPGAPGQVLERRDPAPEVMVLRLARPPRFSFVPGQYVRLGLGGKGHPYSIASTPADPHLEVAIELVPTGRLTPQLFRLRSGDRVTMGEAAGGFILDGKARVHLMAATVTGVVPFVSMIRQALARPGESRFVLLHGAAYQDELVFGEELAALAAAHPARLTYVPAVSRPTEPRNAGWTGASGRLGDHVQAHFPSDPAGLRVYACGHPGMVADVRARAAARQLPISTETYWKL